MIGVDLFSGAGGLTLGARWSGVDVRFAVELHEAAARTHARNHPHCTTIQGDLRYIHSLLNGELKSKDLIVFGGPPCQAFSTSNQRTRGPDNNKNYLFREFLRMVHLLRPGWVVFENVPGILESRSIQYVAEIERRLHEYGYDTTSGVLNAVDYGVPQARKRFFIIGALGREAPALPAPSARNRLVTVEDAIADLPVLSNGASTSILPYFGDAESRYGRMMRGNRKQCSGNLVSDNAKFVVNRYKYIPQGGNWSDIPARLMNNYHDRTRCHTGIYHRLRLDLPSVVIGNFRKNMLIHPTQDRGLSVREAARLQSFPDWYQFEGSIGLQQQQVGNAVPPLLAKAVFCEIVRSAKGL